MIDVVKIERKAGAFIGNYEMYSEREASKRNIPYVNWATGLANGDFLPIHDVVPHCLVPRTLDKYGRLLLPPMVIPVLRVNYNICRVIPRLGRNAKELFLATKRWIIYANDAPEGKTFFNPTPDASWTYGSVTTPLNGFMNGFTNEHFAFFVLYLNYLNAGKSPKVAVYDAYVKAFNPKKPTQLRAEKTLIGSIEYMKTGNVDIAQIQKAFVANGMDGEWVASRLKEEAENEMSKSSERMEAIREILKLAGVSSEPAKTSPIAQIFGNSIQVGGTVGGGNNHLPGRTVSQKAIEGYEEVEIPPTENE